MKKLLTIGLLSGYLFMALVLSHIHNHPLTEAGDDSCPAYIIATVMFSENLPVGLSDIAAIEFNGLFLQIASEILNPQKAPVHHSNRAPPFFC